MSGEASPDRVVRLDLALVERGLARARGPARELIRDGRVLLDGLRASKASEPVSNRQRVEVKAPGPSWVGRGAAKLEAALNHWPELATADRRAADVGASTGGFTQVLLARGVREVWAIDVGHDQLAPMLRSDPRVHELSGTSVRGLHPAMIGGGVDLLVADLSFISLAAVMADLRHLCAESADLVLLIKPQFEVGRARLGKKGVVKSAPDREAAIRSVLAAARECDLAFGGLLASPMTGSHGNHEYLVWLRRTPEAVGGTWQAVDHEIDMVMGTRT